MAGGADLVPIRGVIADMMPCHTSKPARLHRGRGHETGTDLIVVRLEREQSRDLCVRVIVDKRTVEIEAIPCPKGAVANTGARKRKMLSPGYCGQNFLPVSYAHLAVSYTHLTLPTICSV